MNVTWRREVAGWSCPAVWKPGIPERDRPGLGKCFRLAGPISRRERRPAALPPRVGGAARHGGGGPGERDREVGELSTSGGTGALEASACVDHDDLYPRFETLEAGAFRVWRTVWPAVHCRNGGIGCGT